MLELFSLLLVFFVVSCVLVCTLKLLVAMVVLPFKIAFWMTKGLVWFFVGVPMLLLAGVVVVGVAPLAVLILALPIMICGAALAGLARLIF